MKLIQLLWFSFLLAWKISRFFYYHLFRIFNKWFKFVTKPVVFIYGNTMGLLSCLSCCKKTNNKEDNDANNEEQISRQNFPRGSTFRRAQTETTIHSSETSSRRYRHPDMTAPILSGSSRQSTYLTIPDTKSFYDNVPSRESGSHQLDGLNNFNFTESEISTIQKPIQANIPQSSSRVTRSSKGYRHGDEQSSSRTASYSTSIKATSNDKPTSQSSLQENKQSNSSPPKLAKIPGARKMPVSEIGQNKTTHNLQPADYSVQAASQPITAIATMQSVQISRADTCYILDSSNRDQEIGQTTTKYLEANCTTASASSPVKNENSSNRHQAHSDSFSVSPKFYKPPKNQYRLSNANEIVQTTTKYLEANSTTVSASSSDFNKFPTISDQFYKPILVIENTRKNRPSRETNTYLHKPYSVYDNLPVTSNSKETGDVGKSHSSPILTDIQPNSETNLNNTNSTASEANSYPPIPTKKSIEKVNSKPGKSKTLPNQLEASKHLSNDLDYKNDRTDITEQYENDVTSSAQIFTDDFTTILEKRQNEETLKTTQNDAYLETYKTTGTSYAVSFPEAQFAEDPYSAKTQAHYTDANEPGAQQLWSSCNVESSKNSGENLLIFPQDHLIHINNEHMQPRIQETLPSGKNHSIYDIPVPNTFADKVLEANESKARTIENDIKDHIENVSEQENKRREVKTNLDEVHDTAKQFIEEIDNFEETQDSSKYYYIEESLRRLVDRLDDMYEDIGDDEYLRGERKKVYKCIFPLFDKLDEKVGQQVNLS